MDVVSFYIEPGLLIPKTPAALQRQSEAHERIRTLYLAGAPLFTKEQISAAREQLKALEGKSGQIKITNLLGEVATFKISTGEILSTKKGKKLIVGKPRLAFRSIQELTSFIGSNLYDPSIASCSVYIRQVSKPYEDLANESGAQRLRSDPDVTEVRNHFESVLAQWQSSKDCQDLIEILGSTNLPEIKQIIAFACGSICFQPGMPQLAQRSMYQHALLQTIREILESKQRSINPSNIKAFAQDPAYGLIDAELLQEHGISLIDNPDGFLRTDDATLVMSFAPDLPVKQVVTELCRPAAMIWNKVAENGEDDNDNEIRCPDADSPRVREMIFRYYWALDLSFDESLFSDIAFYVREGS